jgi:hypothetical protein
MGPHQGLHGPIQVVESESYFVRQYLTKRGFGFGFLARPRRKRRANRLKSGSVSLTIRQTLASRTPDGNVCTFPSLTPNATRFE